jgi:parallel beta-helix repeat protein
MKTIIPVLLVILVMVSMFTSAFIIRSTKAASRTWFVDDNLQEYPAADFTEISDAVKAAADGDLIYVYPGTYVEWIWVNKRLTIESCYGAEVTSVQTPDPSFDVFSIRADNVTISGFTITGANNWGYINETRWYEPVCGVHLIDSHYCNISNNRVLDNNLGIVLYNSSSNVLSSNLASCIWAGVELFNSNGNILRSNNVSFNKWGDGIYLCNSSSNVLYENYVDSNGWGLDVELYGYAMGIWFWEGSENNMLVGNIVSNNGYGTYFCNSSNNHIYHNNFICNIYQAGDYYDYYHWHQGPLLSINSWDDGYPSGGNYWSDYTAKYPAAKELDGSGIWDTHYVISVNSRDNYPLINRWVPPKFKIGDWVQTTASLNVREGPGLSYTIIGIVSNGSLGQVIDGSVNADGHVWWNVDYIVGVEGWSAEDWLEIAGELSGCGRPVLVSPLEISQVLDTLTAEFTIQNCGDASITLNKLLVGGRFNGGTLGSGNYPDFPYESLTLAPGESHNYTETMELSEVGNYQFFVSYYIENPTEQERRLLEDNWNTCIDLAEGLTDKDRTLSLEKWPAIVISSPLLLTPSSRPYYPGDLLVAQFSIKNVGSVPVTLKTVAVGGRDLDGVTVDLEWGPDVTVQPAGQPSDEYTYVGTRMLPGKIGNYHFFCAYQAADGSWNPCIDLSEGLTDADRVKDIYVESEYQLGGIVIPEVDFPEGKGNVIPIYVPPVIDGSNVIREDDGWETVRTLVKTDSSWDWGTFLAGLGASGAEVWDPVQNHYVPTPEGSALSLLAGILRAASGAQTVIQIGITIQRDSQWNHRAIVQVSDPGARVFYDTYAVQGMYSIVPGDLPWNVEDAISDDIADYFKLPAAKFSETYLETWYIDKAHKNEEYNCYLSLSKGNRIELTPKIYQGDALGFNLWKEHLIFFFTNYQEVVRLEGQAYVDFERARAPDAESKMIQEALAPISLVSESAILLNGGSPCEFRIWDSQGRVTGLVNGEMREEIPSSIYLSEAKTIIVYDPAGDLYYETLGTDRGTYELNITLVKDWKVTTFNALSIPITSQATHQYFIDWDTLTSGGNGVHIQVDSDGDSVFEYNFTSDGKLSRIEYVAATTEHDLDVNGIVSSRSVVGEGSAIPVNVTIMNYGVYPETFNITLYANTTLVATQVVTLANASSTTISFTWNTNGFAKGNYTLSAVADQVPGETYAADNTLIGGWVLVTLPGDVDGNRIVNISDIVKMAGVYDVKQPDQRYNAYCDIDGDGDIDIIDIVIAAGHYGQSW